MKTKNYLKIGIILLVIITIALIGYVGIYVPQHGRMQNIVPDYQWGRDIAGSRVLNFAIDDSTNEVIKDKDGNVIESATEEEIAQNGYTKTEEKVNPDDSRTEENYQKAKEIMEERIKKSGFSDYMLRLNRENGEMTIELREDQNTDDVINLLYSAGKFEVTDSQTNEVLLNNEDVEKASVLYSNNETGSTIVYLNITLKKEAKAKLEEISKNYVSSTDEEGNTVEKKVTMAMDGQTLIESSFDEPITTGEISLSLGSGTTNSQVQTYVEQASMMATLLNTGNLPFTYTANSNKYIEQTDKTQEMIVAGAIFLGAVVIGILYWIIRYRKNGVMATISLLGLPALILLIVRLTNVEITIAGVVAIGLTIILNYCVLTMILHQLQHIKKIRIAKEEKIIKRAASLLVPLLIVAIVCTFMPYATVSSFGMNLFWGMALTIGYHLLITKPLLEETNKPKKGEE